MKVAEIIAVGTELLTPQRIDTNSLSVTEILNLLGVELIRKQVLGDERERLTEAIRAALERAHILVLIGGLGPTEDDVTRDAAAAALGRKLVLSLEQESVLINRFRQLNRPMAKNNLRQAYLIEGAEALAERKRNSSRAIHFNGQRRDGAAAGTSSRAESNAHERGVTAVALRCSSPGNSCPQLPHHRYRRIGPRHA